MKRIMVAGPKVLVDHLEAELLKRFANRLTVYNPHTYAHSLEDQYFQLSDISLVVVMTSTSGCWINPSAAWIAGVAYATRRDVAILYANGDQPLSKIATVTYSSYDEFIEHLDQSLPADRTTNGTQERKPLTAAPGDPATGPNDFGIVAGHSANEPEPDRHTT